jgi:type II secretory pathway component PulF
MNAGTTWSPLLGALYGLQTPGQLVGAVMGFLFLLASTAGTVSLIHFFLTLPMRRAERAQLFLDLLEGALQRGQAVERMILSIAQSRDRTVGMRFHLLAAYIESGLRFGAALEKVPRFLPPQISAMLHAGEKLGDLRRVLPACREILRDRSAGVRSAIHYMVLVIFLFSPSFVFVVLFTVIIFLLLVLATLIYIGGPQFIRWFQFRGLPFVDWVAWRVPWKQKRLQRTFSAMLAVLLDGGVPEAEAVQLAGDCTANEICRHRARRVLAALKGGIRLDEAVRAFDDHGEFHWRLTNAIHARGGFLNALRGWHETLDARAFQQEEATAHAVTSGLVILNGVLVGLITTAMFGILIAMLWRATEL